MTTLSRIYTVTPCGVCVDPETLVATLSNHEKRMDRARARTQAMEDYDNRLKRLKEQADKHGESVLSGIAGGIEAAQSARVGHRKEVLEAMETLVVGACAEADEINCSTLLEKGICPKLQKIVSIQPALQAIVTGVPEQ